MGECKDEVNTRHYERETRNEQHCTARFMQLHMSPPSTVKEGTKQCLFIQSKRGAPWTYEQSATYFRWRPNQQSGMASMGPCTWPAYMCWRSIPGGRGSHIHETGSRAIKKVVLASTKWHGKSRVLHIRIRVSVVFLGEIGGHIHETGSGAHQKSSVSINKPINNTHWWGAVAYHNGLPTMLEPLCT